MEYSYFDNIVTTLKSVERPGFYATGGVFPMPLPSLSINTSPGSILGLPLCDCQVKSIISSVSQAPFGRGEDTIVDTSVRCTWQLDHTQFSINNLEWPEQIKSLLDKVKVDLGCHSQMTITCELYKLLLYEPGGFFKCHRDTEKSERMFGTLVIQLPSNFSGGQLMVYHQSKHMEFDFGGPAGVNNFHYAAFYADCQHEIKPITEGYCLCLVYNLMYSGSSGCPTPANNQELVSDIVSSMREWNDAEECPPMMTYLLDHQYCDASLSFQLLKNGDRAVTDVLVQARSEVKFDLYLAKVNLYQNWSGYIDCDDFSEEDLNEEYVNAVNLKSYSGSTIPGINIKREYFVPEDFLENARPDSEDTGNEGATVDKQYSWGALLLWPSKNSSDVVGFANMIRLLKQAQDRKEELEAVAKDILRSSSLQCHSDAEGCVSLLQSLEALDNLELIHQFLELVGSSKSLHSCLVGNSLFSSEILTIGCKYGWDPLRPHLQAIFDKAHSFEHEISRYFQFLDGISRHLMSEGKDTCEALAAAMIGALSKGHGTNVHQYRQCDQEAYVLFFKVLLRFDEVELVLQFLEVLAPSEVFHRSLIESHSFRCEIVTAGRKYTWSALKSPLQVIFDKLSSGKVNIEKYCKFLYSVSNGELSEDQKAVCRELATVVVNAFLKGSGVNTSSGPLCYHGGCDQKAYVLFLKCLYGLDQVQLEKPLLQLRFFVAL